MFSNNSRYAVCCACLVTLQYIGTVGLLAPQVVAFASVAGHCYSNSDHVEEIHNKDDNINRYRNIEVTIVIMKKF